MAPGNKNAPQGEIRIGGESAPKSKVKKVARWKGPIITRRIITVAQFKEAGAEGAPRDLELLRERRHQQDVSDFPDACLDVIKSQANIEVIELEG